MKVHRLAKGKKTNNYLINKNESNTTRAHATKWLIFRFRIQSISTSRHFVNFVWLRHASWSSSLANFTGKRRHRSRLSWKSTEEGTKDAELVQRPGVHIFQTSDAPDEREYREDPWALSSVSWWEAQDIRSVSAPAKHLAIKLGGWLGITPSFVKVTFGDIK
jgi:hypothetical protein